MIEFGATKFATREGTSDANTVISCYREDEYEIRPLDLTGKLVFDVGAHIGGFTILAAEKGADVVALEPVPANARLIEENALLNGLADRVTVVDAAARNSGQSYVWWNRGDSVSDVHHGFIGMVERTDAWGGSDGQLIRTYSYADMQSLFGTPDVLKLDCEGGEWWWLAEVEVRDVPLIIGEWHPVEGHRQWEINGYLDDTHTIEYSGEVAGPSLFRATKRG